MRRSERVRLLRKRENDRDPAMTPNIIVMIVTLLLPTGHQGIHVTPFVDVEACKAAADVEASDPKVQAVECAELIDGALTLKFKGSEAVGSEGEG